VTLLVDTKVNAILDLHVTRTRKHARQIAPSMIKHNPENIEILLRDKGYDHQKTIPYLQCADRAIRNTSYY